MTPEMTAALSGRRVLIAGLFKITFPGGTLRLCDGGTVSWGSEIFVSRDADFGAIGSAESISEAAGDTIPSYSIKLMPPDLAAAVAIASPDSQGSPVRAWLAVVDAETGEVVPDPELLFAGEVDTVTLEIDRGIQGLAIDVVSVFDRMFDDDEGARMSSTFHKRVHPGELGFDNMTGTPIDELWGPGDKPPAASIVPGFPNTGVQQYF